MLLFSGDFSQTKKKVELKFSQNAQKTKIFNSNFTDNEWWWCFMVITFFCSTIKKQKQQQKCMIVWLVMLFFFCWCKRINKEKKCDKSRYIFCYIFFSFFLVNAVPLSLVQSSSLLLIQKKKMLRFDLWIALVHSDKQTNVDYELVHSRLLLLHHHNRNRKQKKNPNQQTNHGLMLGWVIIITLSNNKPIDIQSIKKYPKKKLSFFLSFSQFN